MTVNTPSTSSPKPATNYEKALAAWGPDMPAWVRTFATNCDRTSQRTVADKLGKSNGYVSRLINRTYNGSYAEAENQVRSVFSADKVICPMWNSEIPLSNCIRNRRYSGPIMHQFHIKYAAICPACPNNTDHPNNYEGE